MALPTSGVARLQRHGIVFGISPSTQTEDTPLVEVWYTTKSTATTSASSNWRQRVLPRQAGDYFYHVLTLPASTKTWYARARHAAYRGVSAGLFSARVSARPADLSRWQEGGRLSRETYRRNNTLYEDSGILKPTVTQNDGTANLIPIKGYQTGEVNGGRVPSTSWVDGSAVTFPVTLDAPPRVRLFPHQGVTYWERRASVWSSSGTFSSTGSQVVELGAINVTAAGFTPRARLVQEAASFTFRDNNFSTALLDATGEASSVTVASAPAYNDTYTARYTYQISRDPAKTLGGMATVSVAVDVNSTGAYVERASATHVVDLTVSSTAPAVSASQAVLVTGVDSTEKARLRVKSFSVEPPDSTGLYALVIDPQDVIYYTSTGTLNFAAMCKSTNDTVSWVAQAVTGGT